MFHIDHAWESSLPLKSVNEAIERMSSHPSETCKPTSIQLFLKLPKYQIIPWSLVHLFSECESGLKCAEGSLQTWEFVLLSGSKKASWYVHCKRETCSSLRERTADLN